MCEEIFFASGAFYKKSISASYIIFLSLNVFYISIFLVLVFLMIMLLMFFP